ncbi:MAG: Phosphoenolpyruvate synthase/pyruvate phosphate dikinase [Candidatus Magasanikbacteria bacterium GW2011_GWC2_37_14]|uniref:Phosphoenolpyruvate synthase/pyruvate phosphate dikinase n=1 Tax=Candidatus Magasanikbacteria bacterium GW2011_GWC2_37_14 TaxID=1619046 RepID=A0A0G0IVL9_9BACT|nr:MAG: Phosphoenolpyruvate synthase/pyruvate phosphate dikinase [Candidatus Magasanikbacteria bacterium GW2011_GWC2_37_14]
MQIPYNKEWQLIEKEDYANYLFVTATWEGFTTNLPKRWGFIPGRYLGAEYINSSCNLFVTKEHFDATNKEVFSWMFTNPKRWDGLHKVTEKYAKEMFVFGKHLQTLNLKKATNKDLLTWINKFEQKQILVHDPRGPMWFLETPYNLLSKYLQDYLQEKYQDVKNEVKLEPNDAFQILCVPKEKSIWTKEKEELAKIVLLENSKQETALSKHTKKYEWLEYGLQGKFLDKAYFNEELNKLKDKGAKKFLENLKKEMQETLRQQKEIFATYNIHPTHQKIFKIVQDSFYTRLLSKDAQFFGYYSMDKIFKEVAKRTYLTMEQVRFLAHTDFERVLIKGEDLSQLASQRMKYSLHIADRGQTVYYSGEEAKKIRAKMKFFEEKNIQKNSQELTGQPAFKGKVTGRVKIINKIQEMAKMHEGNILVSHMTNPSIVPAMKKAAAIITDLGGITCHAAIVARELKVPCIIGTKVATDVLHDGDEVEVDADKGVVRKI